MDRTTKKCRWAWPTASRDIALPAGLAAARRAALLSSCQEFHDDVPVDVRQAEVTSGVAVGEPFMVEAEQVQDGGVQVVHVDLVLDRLEAELVGGAVDVAALDA